MFIRFVQGGFKRIFFCGEGDGLPLESRLGVAAYCFKRTVSVKKVGIQDGWFWQEREMKKAQCGAAP